MDDSSSPPARRLGLKRVLKLVLAVVVVGFVGYYLVRLFRTTDFERDVALRWPWLVASAGAMLGMYLCILLSEWFLLHAFTRARLPLSYMPPVTWIPLLGKFIPGKVASVLGATYVLKRAGISTVIALSVFVLLDALPVLIGIVLSGLLLMEPTVQEKLPGAPIIFGVILVGGLVMLSPPVSRRVLQGMLRLMKRPPLPHTPTIKDYGWPLLCALAQWMFNAAAVGLMCVAFAPVGEAPTVADWPSIVGITALVMCASYFGSFVVSQGFGVREFLFIPLLSQVVPPPAAAAATVALRLVHVAMELGLAGVGLAMFRRIQAPTSEPTLEPTSEPASEPAAAAPVAPVAEPFADSRADESANEPADASFDSSVERSSSGAVR